MKKEGSLLTGLITVVAVLAVLSLGISAIMRGCSNRASQPSPTPQPQYPDPLKTGYSDPSITQTEDGYYLTATDGAGNAVVFFADTITGLSSAEPKTLEGVMGAVSLYKIDYIWVLLGMDGAQYTCADGNPLEDAWTQAAPGEAGVTASAIADGDIRLLIRCGAEGITLTRLEGLEKTDDTAVIAQSAAQPVNAVAPMLTDGRLHLIYTAGEGAGRAAYMLSLSEFDKWNDAASWVQLTSPVFGSDGGAGSLSFVKDGEDNLFAYGQTGTEGQPIIRVQRYYFSTSGLPVFGLPETLE